MNIAAIRPSNALKNAAWRERAAIRGMAQDAALIGTRRLVHDRALAKQLSMPALSKALGRSASYLTTWLYRGTPKVLPEDVLLGLARTLEVTVTSLREQPLMGALDSLISDLSTVDISERSPCTLRDVPLRKADRPLGWPGADVVHALRPAHLAQTPPSFAFISDERHQRFPVGSCLYVNTDIRPQPGDLVAIYRDGSIVSTAPLDVAQDVPGAKTLWKIVSASFP